MYDGFRDFDAQLRDTVQGNAGQVDAQLTLMRATRYWIQYGVFGFAVACIVIGAVEGIFGG
jgi:hypothetical protein